MATKLQKILFTEDFEGQRHTGTLNAILDEFYNRLDQVLDAQAGPVAKGVDLALWKPYTCDRTPNATYTEVPRSTNGVTTASKGLLTHEGFNNGTENQFQQNFLGFRAQNPGGELGADRTVRIRVDLGSAETVATARAMGYWETGNDIYHPEEFTVAYSNDDVSFTTFGDVLTGMSNNPGTLNSGTWVCEATGSVAARYWRFTIKGHSPDNINDWLFVGRVRLLAA